MKNTRSAGVVFTFLFLLLAGCVPSLHPLYTESDVVSEPALFGTWVSEDGSETWVFAAGEGKAASLTCRDKDGNDGRFTVHYLKIGEHGFVDFFPDKLEGKRTDFYKLHQLPVHTFLRVREIGAVLKLEALDFSWIETRLKEHPEELKHEWMADDNLVLTAQPRDLQAFILKHADSKDAWSELKPLKRQ